MGSPTYLTVLQRRHRTYFAARQPISFAVQPLHGPLHVIGSGPPAFTLTVRHPHGEKALGALDQFGIASAYIDGQLDLDGDVLAAMLMRGFFRDIHPQRMVSRYAAALLSNARRDEKYISAHYDNDPDFFLTFLDRKYRCYTQGSFVSESDPLEEAIGRKMALAGEAIKLKPGDHVLDVGGGWGAFPEYATSQGAEVTTLTLSADSADYLRQMAASRNLPMNVVRTHFLTFQSKVKFDAIVNMGTTEHLPRYGETLRAYSRLLRPNGFIYLDALAMRSKYRASSFLHRYIYPGSAAPLVLHSYLRQVASSPFSLVNLNNERRNYQWTCMAWAKRLDAAREEVTRRWGEPLYRRFRLFLWGSAAGFATGKVQAYRWTLHLPGARSAVPAAADSGR